MSFNGYGVAHDNTPLLLQINEAIRELSVSNGRIESDIRHIETRLENGDSRFAEIQDELHDIKGKVAMSTHDTGGDPTRLETAQQVVALIKEAWPYLAATAAGAAKLVQIMGAQ